jgi:hypothetical protein
MGEQVRLDLALFPGLAMGRVLRSGSGVRGSTSSDRARTAISSSDRKRMANLPGTVAPG